MPPEKRLRLEDDSQANFEDLLAEMTYGMKKKSKKVSHCLTIF